MGYKRCTCGATFMANSNAHKFCDVCAQARLTASQRASWRRRAAKYAKKPAEPCVVCGRLFHRTNGHTAVCTDCANGMRCWRCEREPVRVYGLPCAKCKAVIMRWYDRELKRRGVKYLWLTDDAAYRNAATAMQPPRVREREYTQAGFTDLC